MKIPAPAFVPIVPLAVPSPLAISITLSSTLKLTLSTVVVVPVTTRSPLTVKLVKVPAAAELAPMVAPSIAPLSTLMLVIA